MQAATSYSRPIVSEKRAWIGRLLIPLCYCVAAAVAAPAQTFQYFNTVITDNNYGSTSATLMQATNGNLYGTTEREGANSSGTVFQITPSGQFITLYNFCSLPSCADGQYPYGGVVQGPDGNLYGTTSSGGANGIGGTVFQLTVEGTLNTLYSFCSQAGCADGESPEAGITIGADGNYYGTTYMGGAYHLGTLFQLTTAGTLNVLYSFTGGGPGANPTSPAVEDSLGNFWGTTTSLGSEGGPQYFEYTSGGTLETGFCATRLSNEYFGCQPNTFTLGSDGNLYLTTQFGKGENSSSGCIQNGDDIGCGEILGITPSTGNIFWQYGFSCSDSVCANGANPFGGVIMGSDGNLYGTTFAGGSNTTCPQDREDFQPGCGTIFVITPGTSNLTTLYNFCSQSNCTDGFNPYATLLETPFANGSATLYGLNYTSSGYTIFSLSNFNTTATVTPASLSFGNQALYETSNPKTVTLTNTGKEGTLNIGSMVPSGAYAISATTCGATLAPKAKCTVSVTFTPNQLGSEPGTLTISDSALAGTQVVALAGTGVTPVTLTPASSNFGKHKVGTTSNPKNFTLKNDQGVALNSINIMATGPFAVSSTTCGSTRILSRAALSA